MMTAVESVGKPDLVIHPMYVKSLLTFDLDTYFNIIYLDELEKSIEPVYPLLVTDHQVHVMEDVALTPIFTRSMEKRSGIKPQYTSYCFRDDIPIYRLPHRAPRYVIWNKADDLTICATYVDRVNKYNLYEAYRRAKDWAYTITQTESIIVFDLDETLIDRECEKLRDADQLLKCARQVYDKIVLYSHGSNLHVDDNVAQFEENSFDLVLSNNKHDNTCNKNLLSLYNYFPNTLFSRATLVDDSLYNWTPEYDTLIVPFKLSSVQKVIPLIN